MWRSPKRPTGAKHICAVIRWPGWNSAEYFFIVTLFQMLKSVTEGIRPLDLIHAMETPDRS